MSSQTYYILGILALALCWGGCRPAAGHDHDYLLATASTGGTFYPVGVAMATLATEVLADSPAIRVSAMNSAGSGENIQLLKFGEADFAMLQGLFGAMAMQGSGKYADRPQDSAFLAVMNLWPNVEHFLIDGALAQTGTMSDLAQVRGEPFSIGKRGSGTETSGQVILEALGFAPETDFRLDYLGYSSAASAMQDGRLAGMNIPAGVPVAAITQAYATMSAEDLALLSFTPAHLDRINAAYPLWQRYDIPAGTYPGQTQAVQSVAQPNFLAVRPGVPEEDVYRFTRAIFEQLPRLHQQHRAARQITLARALVGLPCALHPGAARYYREAGLIPTHEIEEAE
jgi:hypothetical protein